MSGHKKARYERKQKFIGNRTGMERVFTETIFNLMYPCRSAEKAERRNYK